MGIPIIDSDNIKPNHPKISDKNDQSKSKPTDSNGAVKELIGNGKEYRVDCNKINLRIIGNGNKIRITQNTGRLDIVGNSTRVKIVNNQGPIKYTGNEGRIYLGNDSSEQGVEYIGCNGVLKVVSAEYLQRNHTTERQEKCKSVSCSDTENNQNTKIPKGYCVKNNISLPNLMQIGCRGSTNITNSINFSSSTGNIVIKNAINVAF